MKKPAMICLMVFALAASVFADDAKVMPMMVGRVYVAPTFSFAPGGYDTDGEYGTYDENVKLVNLGLVVEYGVIDWITAAVQWAPGWTLWSDVQGAASALKPPAGSGLELQDVDTNGFADLFVGAKIQIVGEKAPVRNTAFRASIAPGVIIPLPGPDFKDVPTDIAAGKDITASSNDRHVFAAGARLYFDWIINSSFFINFYNETIFYPIAQDLNKDEPTLAAVKAGLSTPPSPLAGLAPAIAEIEGDVQYKYKLTFEIEPVFTKSVADGVSFSAGLPVTYKFLPAYDYSFDYPASLSGAVRSTIENRFLARLKNTNPQHSLYVKPGVSLFFTNTPLPLEFKLQYALPVWGKNTMARHDVTLQLRAYFALPGRPE